MAAHYCGVLRFLILSTSVQPAIAARTTSRIISRCMTLPPYFQRDPSAVRLVRTTFSCARGLSLFSQGSRPCRLFGKSAGPNGCGRRDQTFPHSLRSGSPIWSCNSPSIWIFAPHNGLVSLTWRVRGFPEARLIMYPRPPPGACFTPPIPCYFGPTDCLRPSSSAWSWKWSDA